MALNGSLGPTQIASAFGWSAEVLGAISVKHCDLYGQLKHIR